METNRIVIKSPKTEHHAGHDQRTIPIFPELVQPLEECRDATGGGNLVFPMLVGRSAAYCRKPVLAAIEAAGIEPWDKLFVALRATRDTELRERYPSHVVDAWIGHDEAVAKKNYLQVTDEHFEKAATENVTTFVARKDSQGVETGRVTTFVTSENPLFSSVCDPVQGQEWAILDSNQ